MQTLWFWLQPSCLIDPVDSSDFLIMYGMALLLFILLHFNSDERNIYMFGMSKL